jgi:hypothetical protein
VSVEMFAIPVTRIEEMFALLKDDRSCVEET